MSITLYSLGAAEEVTGSKHIFEIDGRNFLLIVVPFKVKENYLMKKIETLI